MGVGSAPAVNAAAAVPSPLKVPLAVLKSATSTQDAPFQSSVLADAVLGGLFPPKAIAEVLSVPAPES